MNSRALKVKDFCNGVIFATERDCPIYDAIRWLDEYRAEHAVIVEETGGVTAVVGTVTREDLASMIMREPDYDDMSLDDVMNYAPIVLREDEDLENAVGRLDADGQDTAIVVNSGGEMIGMLALADVIQFESRSSPLASAA